MSGSFAPMPAADEIPTGMVHVGWRCTAPDRDCLMPLSRADSDPIDGEVHLFDANHHASWAPVYVWRTDIPEERHEQAARRRALDDAFARTEHGAATTEDKALIERYFAEACGDCVSGRCHWGATATRTRSLAAGERCGCARHEASQKWRWPDTPKET